MTSFSYEIGKEPGKQKDPLLSQINYINEQLTRFGYPQITHPLDNPNSLQNATEILSQIILLAREKMKIENTTIPKLTARIANRESRIV